MINTDDTKTYESEGVCVQFSFCSSEYKGLSQSQCDVARVQ